MPKLIKVENATPRSDLKSLCLSCRNASIVKGRDLQYMVQCHAFDREMTFPVIECSSHDDRTQPSLSDMRTVAWNIETRNRGAAGFNGAEREVEITPPKRRASVPWDE